MKNLKNIITTAFISLGILLNAQDAPRADKISAISTKPIAACTTGAQSTVDLDDNLKEKASLYSEYFKQKDYKSAISFWRPLFFNAPKYSKNLHLRGIKMYKQFAKDSEGEQKEAFLDTLFAVHDTRIHCFGSSAKLEQSKAFDYYSFRAKGNHDYVYQLFEVVYDKLKEENATQKADPTYLLFWMKATIRANKYAKSVTDDELFEKYETITNICEDNITADINKGKYVGARDAVTEELKKGGYLVPAKIMELAETKFRSDTNNENNIVKAYKAMKACGNECTETPLFTEVVSKLVEKRPSSGLYKFLASKATKSGDKTNAINYLNKAIDLSEDNEEKSNLYYKIAQIHSRNGSLNSAREYARKVLAINPNSGAAYILIGSTYASSGKACSNGVGTGFKAQVVVWAAIDTWQKARSIDPSVSQEAQKLINKYSQFMPSKEDLFLHSIAVGSKYTIDCLGLTTTVRSSD